MKRESKVYSFKEQQEEMQLRKELEEKKKKAGLIKAPELNEKQKETMRLELEKETAIRTKLRKVKYCLFIGISSQVSLFKTFGIDVSAQMHEQVNLVTALIRGAAVGNGPSLSLRFRTLLPVILRNTQSLLAAKPLCNLFIDLRKCVDWKHNDLLGLFIGHLTLRYEQPKCELDKAWTEEDIGRDFNTPPLFYS